MLRERSAKKEGKEIDVFRQLLEACVACAALPAARCGRLWLQLAMARDGPPPAPPATSSSSSAGARASASRTVLMAIAMIMVRVFFRTSYETYRRLTRASFQIGCCANVVFLELIVKCVSHTRT